jgi:hypothetical protein
MWKSGVGPVWRLWMMSPCLAQADEFEQGMSTMWEVLWHQSGTPTRLVRWEQDIKVRIYGVNVNAHRQHTLQALRDAGIEAGVQVIDVSDRARRRPGRQRQHRDHARPHAGRQPALRDLPEFPDRDPIDSAAMQMRNRDAWRCAYHESMHVMGVRGHPGRQDGPELLPDQGRRPDAAGQGDAARLVLPAHARRHDALRGAAGAGRRTGGHPARQGQDAQARERSLRSTIDQMQAFADGKGDVPMIVKRSASPPTKGIRFGRMEMSYFLGIAYLEGATGAAGPGAGPCAGCSAPPTLGSRTAQAPLGAATGALTR